MERKGKPLKNLYLLLLKTITTVGSIPLCPNHIIKMLIPRQMFGLGRNTTHSISRRKTEQKLEKHYNTDRTIPQQ